MMFIARVLLSLLCFITMVNGQLSSPDKEVMAALNNALKLPGNKNLFTDQDPCLWKGKIQCQGNRVTAIQIKNLNISGTLPADLISLSYLKVFEVMNNNITGKIPSLSGLKSLETFNVHNNEFTSIDKDFFIGLTSLQHVFLDNNPFDDIHLDLADATSLVEFSAVNCNLHGTIEDLLGGLKSPSLTTLHLSNNFLSGELPASFSGSPVQSLMLNGQKGNEKLTGSISVLQYMTSLTEVSLQGNSFSGPIPNISGLDSLKSFNVRENQLTGIVPSFDKLSSLSDVALGNNLLQGPTPNFNIKPDLDGVNSFCLDTPGTPCDSRVTTLLSIVEAFGYPVRFAESWKGNDPCSSRSPWVGITCVGGNSITVINFKNMGLNGTISPRFADLGSLQVINLSQNKLTGPIPKDFTDLKNLTSLDVSNNLQLCGNVPVLNSNTVVNTNGNSNTGKDCLSVSDGAKEAASTGSRVGKTVGYVIGIVLVLLVMIGFAIFFLVKKKKQYRKMHPRRQSGDDQDALKITIENLYVGGSESDAHLVEGGNIVFSIQVLRDATDNFDEKNILGRGGFGIVYKGELHDGTTIAVKRMESSVISGKGLDEFKSEIAVLTRVRHRNLVSLHGYCLEGNERLLVYQYMPQGTLSSHIFNWQEEGLKPLEWTRRLLIALDVARGVEYLHLLAHQSFIHRDLKPSNILLGDDMHAKVADFGLVKLAPVGTQSIETKIAGTFGYLAPEYAVTGRVTTKVDVYSFGVILMELLTGRKALDVKRSEQDVHLATWFRRMFIDRDSFSKAIDETIEVNEDTLGSINKVAELAIDCSAREPKNRPDNMSYVVNVLVSLVEQWKPTERSRDSEDIYGIDYETRPQLTFLPSHFGDNYTMTSIPSQPPELDNTLTSGHGR